LLSGSLALLAGTSSPAETVTLIAVADTTLNQDFSTFNMGGHTHVAAGLTAGGGVRRGLFRFDLAEQVPAGSTIESAELQLTVPGGNVANPSPFALHRVLVDWTEGDKVGNNGQRADAGEATWAWRHFQQQAWSSPGGATGIDYAAAASATQQVGGLGDYTWSGLADDVAAWLAAPESNFGWLLMGTAVGINRTARRFAAREAGDSPPQLTIEFTPPVIGDANGDRHVDLTDFGILKSNFGQSPAGREQGDFSGDGKVDLTDFGLLKDNFGQGGAAVPEPAAWQLAAVGLAALAGWLSRLHPLVTRCRSAGARASRPPMW
jgi:hypothetical protein